MEEHTGFTPWMLTTPYSLKLLSSLLWEEASRNTRNCSKPWSTQKGLSFPKRFSGIQKSSTFPHGSEHTQSVWLKAVLQSEFKGITYVLNLVNSKLKKKNLTNTHTHTLGHTQTKVLIYSSSTSDQISSLHLLNYNVQKVRQHWTAGQPGALHHFPQCEWEVFFQGCLCIPKEWIHSMSVK
jgi:hypothetical protein